jgi:hypothetical protein
VNQPIEIKENRGRKQAVNDCAHREVVDGAPEDVVDRELLLNFVDGQAGAKVDAGAVVVVAAVVAAAPSIVTGFAILGPERCVHRVVSKAHFRVRGHDNEVVEAVAPAHEEQ